MKISKDNSKNLDFNNKNLSFIQIYGAKEHFLKNITCAIPREQLVVVTGVSGSGKSSLVFDTIFAESQRRYMETFSSYVRNLIGSLSRPDVDKIDGLGPSIAIDQKTTSKNPKSTVGTTTGIYDFLRLFFAKCSTAYSYVSGKKMEKQSDEEILNYLGTEYLNMDIAILGIVIKAKKGNHKELISKLKKSGYTLARINGVYEKLSSVIILDRFKAHDIEVVVDRLRVNKENMPRLAKSIEAAFKFDKNCIAILDKHESAKYFSKNFIELETGVSYEDPSPNSFSFNSPYGACEKCEGIGKIAQVDIKNLIPNKNLSFKEGAIPALGAYKDSKIFQDIDLILKSYDGISLTTPIYEIPAKALDEVIYGGKVKYIAEEDKDDIYEEYFDFIPFKEKKVKGIVEHLYKQKDKILSSTAEDSADIMCICDLCEGSRLKKESLYFKIAEKSIYDLSTMSLSSLKNWIENVSTELSEKNKIVARDLTIEISKRLKLLLDMGLDYINLERPLNTLSGGECQRIRLATQIGTQLVGVLYIMDEPSIGLHQHDNTRLINAIKQLRDLGNSIIVVEHDKDIMREADYLIDIGPAAGINGGHLVAAGTFDEFLQQKSETADFLTGEKKIEVPAIRRPNKDKFISLKGCNGYNLKNIDIRIPLKSFTCITGLSGSGKSTLINSTLVPAIKTILYNRQYQTSPFKLIEGVEQIENLVEVSQDPIGRTPRSNPATYTGIFDLVRAFFAQLPEAKIRGYQPGRFSFNLKGGRCEDCEGGGIKVISMNFMDEVHVDCDTCRTKRYNRETLEIKYRGLSISDVLDMTVDKAVIFFEKHPKILKKLETLQQVGLGYIKLGQHATTLSGGEAQRVKLATELAKRGANTIYVLDEPSTGLHFSDIKKLLYVLNTLIDRGNTVLVIEHNLDIIKVADYIIDMGPESGPHGGNVVIEGTPEEVAKSNFGYTSKYLKQELLEK